MLMLPAHPLVFRLILWLAALAGALGSGCATQGPPAAPPLALFDDSAFGPPAAPFDPKTLFALTPEMRSYARDRLPEPASNAAPDLRQQLIQALYAPRELSLSYDGSSTRTAAEAFAARSGNCLSLVIMTAAFAKHFGIPVSYRNVLVGEHYSRSTSLYLSAGHVNLVLGPPREVSASSPAERSELTVDFLPASDTAGQHSSPLQERTIVAMYLNNRAVEALDQGQLAAAYGWAREALLQDPAFVSAANTLAVVYQRGGHPRQAEAALRHVLAAEPAHTAALSNLVGLLARTGRQAESEALAQELARTQPVPPFFHFDLGRRAMAAGNYAAARRHFADELRRQPYQDEVHFWLALAYWHLGDMQRAEKHLRLASENSLNRSDQARYVSKLDALRGAAASH